LGLKSAVAIGANTTFWLNTDRNNATGYKVFTAADGAEYNINIDVEGNANLYSGAAGQTFVTRLDSAKSADGMTLEVALPAAGLGIATAASGIDVQADVNDAIYLPSDYAANRYSVLQDPYVPQANYGNIALDGNLNDWNQKLERLDYVPSTQVAGQALYGKNTVDGYVIGLSSDRAIGQNTTIWLNTDQNSATGYQIFGSAGGAEYNINIGADGKPALYTGAAGQTFVRQLDYALSADGKTLEVALPKNLVTSTANGINILADVNDAVFIPGDYGNNAKYTIDAVANTPARTDLGRKVAIVFSETSANKYFDRKSYHQLVMSAQNQAMMAGLSFDVITESDLTNLSKLVNYDTIVFPSFTHVQTSQVDAIANNLSILSNKYQTGIVTAGEFMTNDQTGAALAGDPYARMKSLLGVSISNSGAAAATVVKAKDVASPVFQQTYAAGETIDDFASLPFSAYAVTPGTNANILAEQTVNGQNYNAVVATTTGGRNVHFANPSIFANTNLVWQGLQWSTAGDATKVSLHMGRDQSIFVGRNDVDLSAYTAEAPIVEGKLTGIFQEWKQKYNFVNSNYINIGNNPAAGETTDWALMRPIYQQWLALGHEIGTHSYTHPDFTSNLTPAQLEFEFNQSKLEIGRQLGIEVTGAATPGNPESLAVDNELQKYFDYASGVGASYDNAIGYLNPDSSTVFITPNTSFDFTLLGFKNLTAAQAEVEWAKEYNNLKTHASQPIIMMPWHDYGPTETQPGYTKALFDNFIARAYNDGTEFVNMKDLAGRVKALDKAQITTTQTGNTITANVVSNDVGKFGLDIGSGKKISSVTNWYAYDNDTVFLPKNGGNFTINLGDTPTKVTHITKLPMRGELTAVEGNGHNLKYSFNGEGTVTIDLATVAGKTARITGADGAVITGNKLEMTFKNNGTHTGSISFVACSASTIVSNPTSGASVMKLDPVVGTVSVGTDLNSTTGADRFILGNATQVLFDDGKADTNGLNDYGSIANFSIAQGDIIQLKGQAANYQITDSPVGIGKAIYYNAPSTSGVVFGSETQVDPKSELIGVIQSGDLNFSLTGNYISYV
jgi:serralysin